MPKINALPASKRLKSNQDFLCVFSHNLKYNSLFFVVYKLPNKTKQARIGIVVSKRCSKLAVRRNRIKRLVREWFRAQTNLKAKDLIFIARQQADRASNKDIVSCLKKLEQQFTAL